MSRVAFDPFPLNLVSFDSLRHAFPEIDVFEGFVFAARPTFLFPAVDPAFVHGIDEILGIRIDRHLAGFSKRFDTRQGCEDFHAVVGGFGKTAADFLFLSVIDKKGAKAAWAWVTSG